MKPRPHNDRRWRKLRAAKLAADPVCQYCGRQPADQVDHVVPISKGGAIWDVANLKSACASCHSRKTRLVDDGLKSRVRVRGVDPATGLPVDPNHWWRR